MPKFLLILVLACVQFSSQEILKKVEEPINDEVQLPDKQTEVLDGTDNDNWAGDDKWLQESAEELTKDDEKWMEEIKDFMKESDEDYDEPLDEVEKLIQEIEHYFRKNNPEYGYYDWLYQLALWFGGDDDDDLNYVNKEDNLDADVDDKSDLDLYYSWLYKKVKSPNKVQSLKRFTSV